MGRVAAGSVRLSAVGVETALEAESSKSVTDRRIGRACSAVTTRRDALACLRLTGLAGFAVGFDPALDAPMDRRVASTTVGGRAVRIDCTSDADVGARVAVQPSALGVVRAHEARSVDRVGRVRSNGSAVLDVGVVRRELDRAAAGKRYQPERRDDERESPHRIRRSASARAKPLG